MIPVSPQPAPERFLKNAHEPGTKWLEENPSLSPRQRSYLWTAFLPDLEAAYELLCAYSVARGQHTVDHFVSVDEDRSRAFDWDNYRLCAGWINSSKSNVPSAALLDPFEVGEGWFTLLLPSLQVVVTDACPEALRPRASYTIKRLGLRDGERILGHRSTYWTAYLDGKKTLEQVEEVLPMLGAAIRREPDAVARARAQRQARLLEHQS